MSESVLDSGYRLVFGACRKVRPEVRRTLYALGLSLSPSISVSDEQRRRKLPMLHSFLVLALVVMVFSLGLNGLFSGLVGRLLPDNDAVTINFLEDKWNLPLYLVVCPTYVALCIQIIMISSRFEIPHRPARSSGFERLERRRSLIALSLAIALAAIFATKYVADVAIGRDGPTYWFNDRIGDFRVLNMAGIYYAFMNFAFLFVTLLALLNYLSIALGSIALARSLGDDECRDIPAIEATYLRFSHAFVLARWLIATFMFNMVVWSRSPLAKTGNIHIAGALLVLAVILFTAVPARYLDQRMSLSVQACGLDPADLGIVPLGARRWLPVADWIIGLGFLQTLWGLDVFDWAMTMLFGGRQI